MQYLRLDELDRATRHVTLGHSEQSKLLPIARVYGEKGITTGFKVYNLEDNTISIKDLGEIIKLSLTGKTVAGVDVKFTFTCKEVNDSPEYGYMDNSLSSIKLTFDDSYYGTLSYVDDNGDLKYTYSKGTLVGVAESSESEEDDLYVVITPTGEKYTITKDEVLTECLSGVDWAKSRVAICGLQNYPWLA